MTKGLPILRRILGVSTVTNVTMFVQYWVTNIILYVEPDFGQFCVAGRHKNDSVWEKSASGGAFSALCKSYCDIGDGIFGARFEGLEVTHGCVHSPDEIETFLKSKYVQSNLGIVMIRQRICWRVAGRYYFQALHVK